MTNKKYSILILLISIFTIGLFGVFSLQKEYLSDRGYNPILGITSKDKQIAIEESPIPFVIKEPTSSAKINLPIFASQTFNNCGPATLSMILSFWGTNISQQTLADEMRPYNNPKGGVDDKSIFANEFTSFAKQLGYDSFNRPNGTIEILKQLTTNGIPVVVRTWLHPNEDIGHFRIVRGFDENKKIIIQDDSYEGKDREISYKEFLEMWQPFNYGYILVFTDDKLPLVEKILGADFDANRANENAIERAEIELNQNPDDYYAQFNIATSNYYLGNFDKKVAIFKKVENKLPPRMLWYQLEPMLAYQQTGNDEKALSIANKILNNGNSAFSEMYQLKGEIFLKQGRNEEAKEMFEKALFYNKNYDQAKNSLKTLISNQ